MKRYQNDGVLINLIILGLVLVCLFISVFGYLKNIWILYHLAFSTAPVGEIIVRVVGIFMFPIGIIAGYF